MRTFRLALLAALTAVAAAGCSKDDDEAAPPRKVTILFTTDEHSHLFAIGNEGDDWPLPSTAGDGSLVGGIARRITVLGREREAARRRGADSVVVSSGDFSQGTLAAVAFTLKNPDLGIMRAIGYDVVALGNHEFDLGPGALATAINATTSKPQLVLTNVAFDGASAADDALAALYGARGSGRPIAPSHVVETERGFRIGFVSSMGYDAALAAFVAAPVRFADAAAATRDAFLDSAAAMIQPEIDALRADGVDAVVLLGHGGVDPNMESGGDDPGLVARLRGVDLVLAGHTHLEDQREAIDLDDRAVPVLAAPAYGRKVGKVELMLHPGARPTLVEDQTAFLDVDSRLAPTTPDVVTQLLLGPVVAGIEAAFLPGTLSLIEGAPVADDPAVLGDLYFRDLCTSAFDVQGVRPGETNALNLDTDAMRAVAATLGHSAEIALQASGAVRADFFAGDITMADVFRMAPLGGWMESATLATPGYPLVHVYMSTGELWGALEGTLMMASHGGSNADYYVSPAGLRVSYDPTRTPYALGGPGWITYLALVPATGLEDPLFDASGAGWLVDPASLRSIVTTYQVAAFAASPSFGIVLRDGTGTPLGSLADAIIHWPAEYGGLSLKDHQALGAYLKTACGANGGQLPAAYDEATAGPVPRRMVCEGALAVDGVCF